MKARHDAWTAGSQSPPNVSRPDLASETGKNLVTQRVTSRKRVQKETAVSQVRQYELIYVVSSDATDQQIADLHTQVEEITARYSGTLDKTENWGRRKLAYEIGPHKEGTYVLEVISGSGELMKEIDRRLRVSDQVIRHVTVRVDEENRVIERARTLRKEDSQRRRVARGLPPERQPGEGPQRNDDDDDRFSVDVEEGI
jgi:small subunit ribosomal protein S6